MILLIQVTDDKCNEDECWAHRVPIDTDKAEIIAAIAVFYPNATSIWMGLEDEEGE